MLRWEVGGSFLVVGGGCPAIQGRPSLLRRHAVKLSASVGSGSASSSGAMTLTRGDALNTRGSGSGTLSPVGTLTAPGNGWHTSTCWRTYHTRW